MTTETPQPGTAAAANEPATQPLAFTRKASGLRREGRTIDATFFNSLWASPALAFAFYWLLFPLFYRGSNPELSMLIAAIIGLPGAFLYGMLTTMMPRSGGDYIFNSRILHPAIGFAGNFSYLVWSAITLGIYTTYISTYGIGAFCRMMTGFTGATGWLSAANWVSSGWGLFITGTAAMMLTSAIFYIGGIRLFFKINFVVFILYVVGGFLIPIVLGLFQNSAGFAHNFNAYAANLGQAHAMSALTRSAIANGFSPTAHGFSLGATVLAVSVFWYIFGFTYSSTYFAGEIRRGKLTHLLSMPGSLAVSVGLLLVITPAFLHFTGYNINAMLGLADPAKYGFASGAPAYPEITAIASGSWFLGAVAIIGFTVGLYMWIAGTLALASRSMFAWAFDRIMPGKLSYVDNRTHSPAVAIAVITIGGVSATAIYAFTTWFSTLSVLLGYTTTLVVTAVAGTLLPYLHKDLFEASPFRRRVLGIPVMTIVGVLSLLGFSAAIAIMERDPGSGASWKKNPEKTWEALGVYAVALALYYGLKLVRRLQGIRVERAYAEIPPE